MLTNRLTKLILSVVLVVATLVALQAFIPLSNPKASVSVYTGRGDYQRYESQHFQPYTGRGDYQRYESQYFQPYTGRGNYQRFESQFFPTYTGRGDYQRFEAQYFQPDRASESKRSYVGMGDLRRIEGMQ